MLPRCWLLILLLGGAAMAVTSGGYDRETAHPHSSRSAVMGTHGMVCASQPLAAQAGLDVLRRGGNAVDAAIAANAVLGLLEPMNCGMGGDLFAIVWDGKTKKLYGLNASGRSPYATSVKVYTDQGMDKMPGRGPLSWSVPGCVDGWVSLLDRFGTWKLSQVLAPAIRYAEEGVPLPEIVGTDFQDAEKELLKHPCADCYLPGGKAPRVGQIFRNPELAASYAMVAKGGRATFYRGEIARRIVKYSKEVGGLFSLKDFADHTSTWVEPVGINYRGYKVYELPPNGQGMAALEILNVMKGYDLRAMGRDSADFAHLYVEAKKLAWADRARWYADPDFAKLPLKGLLSDSYAAKQRARIDMKKAAAVVEPGDPWEEKLDDTVYLCAADGAGNAISLIQSNAGGWGSYEVPDHLGFVIQNRGGAFSFDPARPTYLRPHMRPFHTIIPAFVTKGGKPWFCFGVMGGAMQPQGHAQVLIIMIDFGMDPQQAADYARLRHDGESDPSGSATEGTGQVSLESGYSDEVRAELEARGHKLRTGGFFGGYQGIQFLPGGVLVGATEVRLDGCAAGF